MIKFIYGLNSHLGCKKWTDPYLADTMQVDIQNLSNSCIVWTAVWDAHISSNPFGLWWIAVECRIRSPATQRGAAKPDRAKRGVVAERSEALRLRPIFAQHFLEAFKREAAKQGYRRHARR